MLFPIHHCCLKYFYLFVFDGTISTHTYLAHMQKYVKNDIIW